MDVGEITDSDTALIRYSEMFENCKISKQTANFLACIKQLIELSNCFYYAIVDMYDRKRVDEVGKEYFCKAQELEDVLFGFVKESNTDKILLNEVIEI